MPGGLDRSAASANDDGWIVVTTGADYRASGKNTFASPIFDASAGESEIIWR